MVNVNAQLHVDNNYPKDNTTTEINIDWANNNALPKLEGALTIRDYPTLTEIDLSEHALTSLTIINCPKLERIDVSNNYENNDDTKRTLEELDLEKIGAGNVLSRLSCGKSLLTEISFAGLGNLTSLNCQNSPSLDRLRKTEQATKIKYINLEGSVPVIPIREARIKYLIGAVEELKQAVGLNPDENLPTVDYTDDDGRTQKRVDVAKLKTDIEDKAVKGSVAFSQLKTEKESVERERDEARTNYDTIKTERDQLQQQVNQKTQELQAIAEKLGLTGQVTQDQILTKIAELMDRPTGDRVSELERQLAEKDRRIGELENEKKQLITKENVIEKSGESSRDIGFTISSAEKKKISQASTGLEAWKVRDKVIKEKFIELKKGKDNAFYLNVGLGSLTVLCLIVSGWLIMRQVNSPKSEPEKSKE